MPQETNQPTALSRILKMLYLKTSHLDCGKKLDQVEFIRNVFYSYYGEKSKKKDEDDVGFPDKSVCSKMINGKIIAPGKLRVFYNSNPQKLTLDLPSLNPAARICTRIPRICCGTTDAAGRSGRYSERKSSVWPGGNDRKKEDAASAASSERVKKVWSLFLRWE